MSRAKGPGPTLSAKGAEEKAARQTRQAEALRANLLKRKAQARARQDDPGPDGPDSQAGTPVAGARGRSTR